MACRSPMPASTGPPPKPPCAACTPSSRTCCPNANAPEPRNCAHKNAGLSPAFLCATDQLQLRGMALVALHVAFDVGARRDDCVPGVFCELQRFLGQRSSNATATQCVGHEGTIDVQGLLPEV